MSRPITFQNDTAPYLSGENLNKMQDELNMFRNLLNIPDGTYTHNGVTYIVKDGIFTYSGGTGTSDVNIGIDITPFTLKAGTYTMSNNSGTHPYILLYSGGTKVVESEYANNGVKTFTIENETTIDKVNFYFGQNTPPASVKPQVEEGTGKTNYTPFMPDNVKNALNESDPFRNIFSTSLYQMNTDYRASIDFVKVKPNTTYVFSSKDNNVAFSGNLAFCDTNQQQQSQVFTFEKPFTTPDYCQYIKVVFANANAPLDAKIQLEEGTKKSNFAPWAGYIVESGSNNNGSYIKFSDGTMICRNKKTFNIAANIAYGALFRTEGIDFPNFPVAFKDVPDISCFCIGVNTALLANWNVSTKEKIGPLIGIRPTSTNAQDYIISYIAIGKWK